MLFTLFTLMFKVFFVVAISYVLCRRGIFGTQEQKSVTTVLMKMVVYFTVFMSSQQDFSLEAVHAILITGVYALVFYALAIPTVIFLSKRMRLDEAKRRVFVSSIIFCNVTFIGYPILQELYSNVGLLCAITFSMIYNVLFYTWGMAYLGEKGSSFRSLFTNKIAIASLLALAMYFLQIKIPEPFASTFNSVGSMTMPLSMIIIGCNLAQSGIVKIIKDRELYLATFIQMVVIPAIVYLVMSALGVNPLIVKISTIIAALPSGSMTTIVATEYDCAPAYAANIMVQTMLAMVVALPMWVFIVGL